MTDPLARNREAVRLAEAARLDLNATLDNYKAALLRNDRVRADGLRTQAHDLVDVLLDQSEVMARVLRDISDGLT